MDDILKGKRPEYDWEINIEPKNIIKDGSFNIRSSFTKAILAIYVSEHPLSFLNGAEINVNNNNLTKSNSKNYHHFFPKNFLKQSNGIEESHIDHILNITIIDEYLNNNEIKTNPPSVYLKQFSERGNDKLNEHLRTHLIDLDEDKVLDDNYETFLKNRAKRVSDKLKERIILNEEEL